MPQRNVEKTPSDCVSMCKYWANGCESADHAMQAHGDAGCYCDKPFEHIYRRLLSRLLHSVVEIRGCRARSSLAALNCRPHPCSDIGVDVAG